VLEDSPSKIAMLIVMQRARPSDDPTTAQVLNSINQHLMTISTRLTSIETHLANLETRVANLEGRVLKLETGGQVVALETGPVPQSTEKENIEPS